MCKSEIYTVPLPGGDGIRKGRKKKEDFLKENGKKKS
jgi:hypothetical protein